ncbi:hypothetical protein PPYR_04659 [Photinus pyralis]|uniref:Uncharacterized protein n=1 Tax=Photinus pyralis TaxID=7054 RepID=A0A5N4AYW3_PHOPY|nr:hypothetical protein PPYR_04659 [Photinus pyralis]
MQLDIRLVTPPMKGATSSQMRANSPGGDGNIAVPLGPRYSSNQFDSNWGSISIAPAGLSPFVTIGLNSLTSGLPNNLSILLVKLSTCFVVGEGSLVGFRIVPVFSASVFSALSIKSIDTGVVNLTDSHLCVGGSLELIHLWHSPVLEKIKLNASGKKK